MEQGGFRGRTPECLRTQTRPGLQHTCSMLLVVCMTHAASGWVAKLPESGGMNGVCLCFPCSLATSPYDSWAVVLQGKVIASHECMLLDALRAQ